MKTVVEELLTPERKERKIPGCTFAHDKEKSSGNRALRSSGKNSTQGKIFDAKLDPVLTRGGNENLTGQDTCSRAGLNRKTIRLSLIDERTEDTGSGAWTEDRAGKSFGTAPAQGNEVRK
jgi:hypothetical protein